MKHLILICAALLCGSSTFVKLDPFPPVHAEVRIPAAAEAMCEAFPAECAPSSIQQPVPFSQERWEELLRISRDVNDALTYRSDWEKFNVPEKWTLDGKEGDCEEFVALKRHRLIALGWPPSMLLVTIVQKKKDGTIHAVLSVRTSRGDIVLDSKLSDGSTEMWFWYDLSAYTFVAQQTTKDPRQWVSLLPRSVTEADWRLHRWTASR